MTINNQKDKAQVLIITIFILTIALVGMFFILNPVKIKLLSMQNFINIYKAYNNAISGLNLRNRCVSYEITIASGYNACNDFIKIIATSETNTNNCYEIYPMVGTCTTAIIGSTGIIPDLNFEIHANKMKLGSTITIYRLSVGEYKDNIKNLLEIGEFVFSP